MATKRVVKKAPAKKVNLEHVPDEFGRVRGDEGRPDSRSILITGLMNEKWRGFTDTLSAESVALALLRAEDGDLSSQMALFQQMEERDPSLAAAMITRRSAVVGLERTMVPALPEESADFKRAKEIADYCAETVGMIPDFDGTLMDIQDGMGKGISVLEIDWEPDGSIQKLRHIPPTLYEFASEDGRFLLNKNNKTFNPEKVYPSDHPYKFMIYRPRMRSGHASRAGVLRIVVWSYVFRNYAIKDWSVFCEVFGMPLRIGKYKRGASAGDKSQLADMMQKMASDAWAVISEDTMIEFKDIVNRGQEPFSAFFNSMRSEYFLAILGQEGTNVTNKYGTKGDSEIKQMVRQDILEADCKQIESQFRGDVLFPMVMYQFGFEAATRFTPSLHFRYEPAPDLAREAEKDVNVLVTMKLGRFIRASDVAKKYGWELAPEGTKPEDMLLKEGDLEPKTPFGEPVDKPKDPEAEKPPDQEGLPS